jgi:protein O-GlcNAc transferase
MQNTLSISTIQKFFQQAVQLHQQGRLADAKALYEGILKIQPGHSESLHLLGVIFMDTGSPARAVELIVQAIGIDSQQAVFYSNHGNALLKLKQFNEAIASYEKAIALKPDYANAYYNRGVALSELNQLAAAVSSYDKAIALLPNFLGALYNRGIALQALKQFDASIASYDQAIAIQPNFAEAHTNRGNALKDQGKLVEAKSSHDKAIAIRPDYAEAYVNRGAVLQDLKQLDLALASFDKAIVIKPDFVGAYYNRGVVLQELGQMEAAIASYDKAIAIKPDHVGAYINRGYVLQFQGRLEEAEACYCKIIAIEPENVEAHTNRGNTLKDQGRINEAETSYFRAMELAPSSRLSILDALMLPPIMGTKEVVLASRVRFEENVERLASTCITLLDPIKESCNTNFYLAYHGLNDKDIQIKVAKMYERACPSLLYTAPHCGQIPKSGQKKRIGFLSKFITKHSVALCFSRVIEGLTEQAEFEVTLLSSVDPQDELLRATYPNFRGTYMRLSDNLESARDQVSSLELDVLVYLDIGMDPFSYFLAFARLARIQCVLGGHPVTTGIEAMDYFISSDLIETAHAQAHYSESLVRLPIGLFYFERPAMPATFKSRSALGLPSDGHIYLCPMMLHKLHPDFDDAISRILELDPSGNVVLVADKKYNVWQLLLERRFAITVPQSVRDRIIFLPWITDWQDFASLNKAADVVLDPFHFGIGTTAITTCSVGTPFVTRPGELMRGRVGLFYAKLMDAMECVAKDCEEYAQKAVAIASVSSLRQSIQAKILANSHVLFENKGSIQEAVEFFRGVEEV